jgi:hypothetical protein
MVTRSEKEIEMRRGIMQLAVLLGAVFLAAQAQAAVVNLSLTVNEGAKTWEAFAQVSGGSEGIADFSIDVVGGGGITVTGSTNTSPVATNFDGLNLLQYGFNQFRSNGTLGDSINAAQQYIYAGANDPAKDQLVLQGVGITPGNQVGNIQSASWTAPVKLAQGTYSGEVGMLTVQVHTGAFINLLNTVASWHGPGNVSPAEQVIPMTVPIPVPEPTMVGLLALGLTGMLARRRKA